MQETATKTEPVRYVLESIYPSRRMMEELKRLQMAENEEPVQAPIVLEPPAVTKNILKHRFMKKLSRKIR